MVQVAIMGYGTVGSGVYEVIKKNQVSINKKVLDAYIEIVTERMSENEEIVLVGFGTLIPRPQTQRLARNPKTGTPVMIPARTTVKFKPGKFLLEAMNAHLK